MVGDQPGNAAPVRLELCHQFGEPGFFNMAGHDRQRIGQRAAAPRRDQHRIARGQHQCSGAALIHGLEMRRDAGFQRKAAEQ